MNSLEKKIAELESRVQKLEQSRFQLVRVKNREELSDQYIIQGMGYLDLSPEKAYRLYNESDNDFIFLDVSEKDYVPLKKLPESKRIPLEELNERVNEIKNKRVSIFVISEQGVRSIKACKILNKNGFYNLNHISGGHRFWPGNQLSYDNNDFDDFLKEA